LNINGIKRPWERQVKQGNRYNPDSFYTSTAWRKARAAFLAAYPWCVTCLEEGRKVYATTVDHINRIKAGGDRLNPDNFQSLCGSCHARKSASESNERHKK
jgi:5-methylcytosine-specific restriction endonuclease McrA